MGVTALFVYKMCLHVTQSHHCISSVFYRPILQTFWWTSIFMMTHYQMIPLLYYIFDDILYYTTLLLYILDTKWTTMTVKSCNVWPVLDKRISAKISLSPQWQQPATLGGTSPNPSGPCWCGLCRHMLYCFILGHTLMKVGCGHVLKWAGHCLAQHVAYLPTQATGGSPCTYVCGLAQ